MMNRKVFSAAAAVVMSTTLLAGCGGSAAPATTAAKAATTAAATTAAAADTTAAATTAAAADTTAAAADDVAPLELMAGCTYNTTSASYRYCEEFADELAKVSGGKLTVVWNPASALGNTTQHYAMMKEGSLDMFSTAFDTVSSLENAKDFSALVVPYIFKDTAHFTKFLESDLLKSMLEPVESANNVKYLGNICTNWPRGLSTSNKAVAKPEDLKGLKIRVSESVATNAVWAAWGANTVSIPASELYGALENGQADGQDNNVISVWNNSYYEVQKYYTELDYVQQANILWMSGTTYNKLNDTQKKWLDEAIAAAWKTNTSGIEDEYKTCKQNMIDAGIQFVDFDKDAFMASAKDVALKLEGDQYRKGLYDEIQALAD